MNHDSAKRRPVLQRESSVRGLPSGALLNIDGPAGPEALLFLHGVGGAAWSWKAQREALSPDLRLYVWSARGHGEARPVADAGLADYYVDAKEAIDFAYEETGHPLFVVGHSMGGLLAIALACDRAHAVKGLFLVDPVYSDGRSGVYGHFAPGMGRIARFMCEPLLRSFEHGGAMSRSLSRWLFENTFHDRERMEAAWPDQRAQIPIEYPRMLREAFDKPTGFELRDFAGELTAPVYLADVYRPGGHSRFPQLLSRLRERLGENFTHESFAAGHYLQLDRPDDVNARLRQFVARYA